MRFNHHWGAALAVALGALPVLAQSPTESDVVYHWRKTVSATGVEEQTLVSDLFDWLDSGAGTIDLRSLEDSRGRRYEMIADAHQDSEGGPVQYEVKLVEVERHVMSEQERIDAWRAANPLASDRDLERFLSERAGREGVTPQAERFGPGVEDWLATAGPSSVLRVSVRLAQTEELAPLPRLAAHLYETEPAFALQQYERRLRAIEERKNTAERTQADLIELLRAHGGVLHAQNWLINSFDAEVTASALIALAADARIEHVGIWFEGEPDGPALQSPGPGTGPGSGPSGATAAGPGGIGPTGGGGVIATPDWTSANDLADMRRASQARELHNGNFKGEAASGATPYTDMCMAIIDDTIDMDHPAWNDSSAGGSRLRATYRYISGLGWVSVPWSAVTTPSHGTKVAACAVADLTQGQDPAIVSAFGRDARTGFAPEAAFFFVENAGASVPNEVGKAVAESPDVINMSYSNGAPCDLNHSGNDAVDEAFLDGIFVAKSGGNNGFSGTTCVVGNPGTASGAFTVNQLDRETKPLESAVADVGASRGGDAIGRSVIGISTYAGPEAETAARADGSYGAFGASSSAAPTVAGGALCLKEHLLDLFGSSIGNEVGYLYALMLIMADGRLEDGSTATTFDPLDEVYGAGRMRLRRFDSSGMDGPWRMRMFSRTIDDGEIASDMLANPDAFGINQPIPQDVEHLRCSAFWHEPNIEYGAPWSADIALRIVSGSYNYGSGTSADPRQRIRLGNVVSGRSWVLRLEGLDVPPSFDTNYYYLQERRRVFCTVMWEDLDRDDADGPSSAIE